MWNNSNTHYKYKEIYCLILVAQLTKLDEPKAQRDTIIAYLDGTAHGNLPRYDRGYHYTCLQFSGTKSVQMIFIVIFSVKNVLWCFPLIIL